MIGVEDIKKVVKLILLSGYLKNTDPLSLFLVGKSGIGKTEILKSYKLSRAIFLTDASYMGIVKILKEKKRLKHVIFPDFIKITQKKRATSDNLISLLNALSEEGLGKIEIYNFSCDFKNKKCGILVATTKASLGHHLKEWEKIGFVQRMIFCSYSYSEITTKKIMEFINKEKFFKNNKPEKITSKEFSVKTPEKLNSQFNNFAKYNFRTLKQFQTLAKCNVLNEGRDKVLQSDITEIIRLSQYLNLNYKEL